MANFNLFPPRPCSIGLIQAGAGAATLALDSAFTLGSAGDCYSVRFQAPVSGSLTDVYYLLTATNGTPGNITCDLRNNNADVPGSTVHATQNATWPSSASKWGQITFGTPFSVTKGVIYFATFYNGDASPTTNFPTVATVSNILSDRQHPFWGARTTGNGYSSTSNANHPPCVVKIGSTLFGNPYHNGATPSAHVRARGMRITGLTDSLTLESVSWTALNTGSNWTLEIFSGSSGPASPAYTQSITSEQRSVNSSVGGCWLTTPQVLAAGTNYRVTVKPSGSRSEPGFWTMVDTTSPDDVLAAGLGNGTIYYTEDDNAGGWTDTTYRVPNMALDFKDYGTAAGGALLLNPGMGGGL